MRVNRKRGRQFPETLSLLCPLPHPHYLTSVFSSAVSLNVQPQADLPAQSSQTKSGYQYYTSLLFFRSIESTICNVLLVYFFNVCLPW